MFSSIFLFAATVYRVLNENNCQMSNHSVSQPILVKINQMKSKTEILDQEKSLLLSR